jgi:glutaredoxin
MALEFYATRTCPHCAELRDRLEFDQVEYVEYDVDTDADARARLIGFVGSNALVPVLVEDGRVTQVGVAGRGCYVGR